MINCLCIYTVTFCVYSSILVEVDCYIDTDSILLLGWSVVRLSKQQRTFIATND